MKRILPLSLFLTASMAAYSAGNWRQHITFDEEVTHVVDTPDFTYFTSRTIPAGAKVGDLMSLFRYDKEGDELLPLSTDNLLSSNTVLDVQYSAEKGYLFVLYSNYDIDFIYDDGRVVYMPAYRMASVNTSKNVSSITIDPYNDRVYLATEFGYVAINDEKHEIAESRNYGSPLKGVARLGDTIFLLSGNTLLKAPVAEPRFSLADYQSAGSFESPYALYLLADDSALLLTKNSGVTTAKIMTYAGGSVAPRDAVSGVVQNVENNKDGVLLTMGTRLVQIFRDGTCEVYERPAEDASLAAGTYDFKEVWQAKARTGLKSSKPAAGGAWTVTRDFMLPDSPSPFLAPYMASHPDYGMLLLNNGQGLDFGSYPGNSPILLSAYRNGRWSYESPAYTTPEQEYVLRGPTGFAIDPVNSKYVYVSSVYSGLARLNLDEPDDIIHLSKTSDAAKNLPGYVELVADQTGKNAWCCYFSAPKFDASGNLWWSYGDRDNQSPERLHFYCWENADLQSSSLSAMKKPKLVEIKGYAPSNTDDILPLRYTGHKNLLVYSQRRSDNKLVIIDTAGTPTDTSDDKTVSASQFTDQDGNSITPSNIRWLLEDPETGNLWVAHAEGVFYISPDNFLKGSTSITCPKVSRNDGTNYADFLLKGVKVHQIAIDGRGRKWFATAGAGIVCTSADGRELQEELTTANSPLPDDVVFGIAYNPYNNSMMITTAVGICEYFLSGSSSGGEDEVRAYPNPVRPDYFGYVTIDPIEAGSLVKIVDASGNIVKEFNHVSGGEVKWDVTNTQFKRVSSGVYYILVSNGTDSNAYANVGKVLVVN